MKSEEYKRGYDAGYKAALHDALARDGVVQQALGDRKLAPKRKRHPHVLFGEHLP